MGNCPKTTKVCVEPSYPCGFGDEVKVILLAISPVIVPSFLSSSLLLHSCPFPSSPLSLLLLLLPLSSSSSPPRTYMYRDLYQHLMSEVVLNTHTDSKKSETIDHVSWGREQQDIALYLMMLL